MVKSHPDRSEIAAPVFAIHFLVKQFTMVRLLKLTSPTPSAQKTAVAQNGSVINSRRNLNSLTKYCLSVAYYTTILS